VRTPMFSVEVVPLRSRSGRGSPTRPSGHFATSISSSPASTPRGDYASFADFSDPDGNSWVLQERGYRNV